MIVQEKIVESKHQKKQIAEVRRFVEFPLPFWRAEFFNRDSFIGPYSKGRRLRTRKNIKFGEAKPWHMICREIFVFPRFVRFEFTNIVESNTEPCYWSWKVEMQVFLHKVTELYWFVFLYVAPREGQDIGKILKSRGAWVRGRTSDPATEIWRRDSKLQVRELSRIS